MQQEKLRFEDWGTILSETLAEVKALRALVEGRLVENTVTEPPVCRQEVLKRLKTTAPTLLKWEREGKVTKLRIGRIAYYHFTECVSAMKKSNSHK